MIRLALALLISSSIHAHAQSRVGADVTDIQDPLVKCLCETDWQVERVCINRTRWAHDHDLGPVHPDELLSSFEARIENDGAQFVLRSKAYYQICQFGPAPLEFTDPALNERLQGQKVYAFRSLKDYVPRMQLALMEQRHQPRSFSHTVDGIVSEETVLRRPQTFAEYTFKQYPGTVDFRLPRERVLGEWAVRDILENGAERVKYVGAVLSARMANGRSPRFGVYTIKIRFYKKAQVKPKHAFDTSAIGIELSPL